MRRCKECNKPIRSKSNKSGYCATCGHKIRQKAWNEKQRLKRNNEREQDRRRGMEIKGKEKMRERIFELMKQLIKIRDQENKILSEIWELLK